jgi:hypothetical protein
MIIECNWNFREPIESKQVYVIGFNPTVAGGCCPDSCPHPTGYVTGHTKISRQSQDECKGASAILLRLFA